MNEAQLERLLAEATARKKIPLDSTHTFAFGNGKVGDISTERGYRPGPVKGKITRYQRWGYGGDRIIELETRIVAVRDAKTLELITEMPVENVQHSHESWEEQSV